MRESRFAKEGGEKGSEEIVSRLEHTTVLGARETVSLSSTCKAHNFKTHTRRDVLVGCEPGYHATQLLHTRSTRHELNSKHTRAS